MDERLIQIEGVLLDIQENEDIDEADLELALYNINQLKLDSRKAVRFPKSNKGVKNPFGLKVVGGLDEEV